MARLILVAGGARSGKSRFAHDYALSLSERPVFLATGHGVDEEMRERIAKHRTERALAFETCEEPLNVPEALAGFSSGEIVLLDCLTMWMSNLIGENLSSSKILERVDLLAKVSRERSGVTIIVSNEVGLGIVPMSPLGRLFRDLSGSAHQALACAADEVYGAFVGMMLRLHPMPIQSYRPGETA